MSPARLAAYDVLRDVTDRDAYANLALPARIRDAELDSRDAALTTELVAGTLRNRGRYDAIIALAARRPVSDIDARTLNVLRLGAHQLLAMRIADHAAVHETVELQRHVGNRQAAGFVNGVLRTIGRTDGAVWDERIREESQSADEALAATVSHPVWIVRALRDALVFEGRGDELHAALAANNDSPRVQLAVLPNADVDANELADQYADALTAVGPSPVGVVHGGGDPAHTIAEIDGDSAVLRVQDQGSQLAALVLTRARPVTPGEQWLDLCAGPGGKTALLGAEALAAEDVAPQERPRVRANEVSPHRAQLVEQATQGLADAVRVVSHDGRDPGAYGGPTAEYDRVLVDAPCSGLGALRRRPEARWRKQRSDLPELTQLQTELLDAAAAHVRPGGLLAYVTCSPHLAETRVTVKRWLQRHPEMRELDARAVVQDIAREPLDLAGSHLSAQLWPHRHGTDAMFISLFERSTQEARV